MESKVFAVLIALPLLTSGQGISDLIPNLFSDGGGGITDLVQDVLNLASQGGDQCNEVTACPSKDQLCQGTPLANLCIDRRLLPCAGNEECSSGRCYKPNGATYGFCDGCSTNSECRGSLSSNTSSGLCVKLSELWRYGMCVQCSDDPDCAVGSFCDSGTETLNEFLTQFRSLGSSFLSSSSSSSSRRRTSSSSSSSKSLSAQTILPKYQCEVQRGSGSECERDGQCKSGNCSRRSFLFFLTSRDGKCE